MGLKASSWVFEYSEATLGSRLVLLALADKAHDDGSNAFPSVDTIARHARMSRRAAQGALRKLEREGHIEATGRTRSGTTVYKIRGVDSSPGRRIEPSGAQNHVPGGEEGDVSSRYRERSRNSQGNHCEVSEPLGFGAWLDHHAQTTGQSVPGTHTKARAKLAARYGKLVAEGRSDQDMRLASVGAQADDWRRQHGYTFPANVLRDDSIDALIAQGRRAVAKTAEGLLLVKESDPEDSWI